jgi:hypothetical protein
MSGGKVKHGTSINRGYIGYHVTWDGIKVFLRSKAEFIYARVLDFEKIPYKLECVTYKINGRNYKPDFFIFDTKYQSIIKIVEIKSLDDKLTALDYINRFKGYFNSIGIEYDAIWKYQSLITKYNLQDDIKSWIETSLKNYDFIPDTRGENNPMFNIKHSEETKKLIGKKCKERNQDPEYRSRNSKAQKEYFESEAGILRRAQISDTKKNLYATRNPVIEKQCKYCDSIFMQKLKGNGFCNSKCLKKWNYSNIHGYGKHRNSTSSYSKQLNTLLVRISLHYNVSFDILIDSLDFYVQKSKLDKIIPLNKGISIKTLKKYNII